MKRPARTSKFESKKFAQQYHYAGRDLGVRWAPAAAAFRVWAPTARSVELLLFNTGHRPETPRVVPMARSAKGTWTAKVKGNLLDQYYRYRLVHPGQPAPVEAVDPYAVATGANGERAMILDLRDTDPKGWDRDAKPAFGDAVDAVIYELHVRDFTIHPSAGNRHPGGHLGVAARGTKGPGGVRTGVDRKGETLALRALSRNYPAVHAAEEQLAAYLRMALIRLAELSPDVANRPEHQAAARRTVRGVRRALAAERRRIKALRLGLSDTQPTQAH